VPSDVLTPYVISTLKQLPRLRNVKERETDREWDRVTNVDNSKLMCVCVQQWCFFWKSTLSDRFFLVEKWPLFSFSSHISCKLRVTFLWWFSHIVTPRQSDSSGMVPMALVWPANPSGSDPDQQQTSITGETVAKGASFKLAC